MANFFGEMFSNLTGKAQAKSAGQLGERSMGRAVAALNVILGREALTESEGWLLLQILKDVRDRQRPVPHVDSLEDCVAYAALKAEARLAEVKA